MLFNDGIQERMFRLPYAAAHCEPGPRRPPQAGPAYDLPIAVGILCASEQVSRSSSYIFIGELSLDGSVRHADGILPMVSVPKEEGFERVFLPLSDAPEASLIGGLEVIPVESLSQLVAHLNGAEEIPAYEGDPEALAVREPDYPVDFSDVRGQEHVKRALEVAAAGGHNVLMSGRSVMFPKGLAPVYWSDSSGVPM